MDWLTIICLIATWAITYFKLGKIIKELKEAFEASQKVSAEAGDVMMAIAKMLEDGKIETSEVKLVFKEYQEMVAAGEIAGKEWKDVFDEIAKRIRK